MQTTPFRLGLARTDITAEVHGIGMLGWARPTNVVQGVETRLHARALVVEEPATGAVLCVVALEICYVTTLLRRSVLQRLAEAHPTIPVDDAALLLAATHTHSAPGGYSHARFDNSSVPGFQRDVLETLVDGTVHAIAAAWERRVPGQLRLAAGEIPPDQPVAFNRSLRAHHRNPEVDRHYGPDERHLAVDREMTLLRAEDADGQLLGLVSWFSVHGTSVHSDNTLITGDNKGYAATFCEEALGEDSVALFLQGASGDVTPNHRSWPGRPFPGGTSPDDHQSARDNGRIQADRALSLVEEAAEAEPLAGPLRVGLEYRDMGAVEVDPDLAGGSSTARTASGAIGTRMLQGTWEGPGGAWPLTAILRVATRMWALWSRATPWLRSPEQLRWHDLHGNKLPVLAVGQGTVFGSPLTIRLVPPRIELVTDHLAQQQRVLGTEPWLPQILPLHLVVLGDLAIVAVPCEPTTAAGRRLRATTAESLGVKRALLTGYADDYSGYATTPEEYDRQGYEGGFTQFGRWTLPAWQTRVRHLAEQLREPAVQLGQPEEPPGNLDGRVHRRRRWLG